MSCSVGIATCTRSLSIFRIFHGETPDNSPAVVDTPVNAPVYTVIISSLDRAILGPRRTLDFVGRTCLGFLFDDIVQCGVCGLKPRGCLGGVVRVRLFHAQHEGRSKGDTQTFEAIQEAAPRQPAVVQFLCYAVW